MIGKVIHTGRAFLGGREVKVTGSYETRTIEYPAGTTIVRVSQPLGTLAAYLLDPESDDGLTTWGFFDSDLAVGKPHPVSKLAQPTELPAQPVR